MNLQNMDGTDVLVYFIVLVIVFFIQAAILRWIFMIKTQVANQNTMILLLKKMCEKQGIEFSESETVEKTDAPAPITEASNKKKGKWDFLGVEKALTERTSKPKD